MAAIKKTKVMKPASFDKLDEALYTWWSNNVKFDCLFSSILLEKRLSCRKCNSLQPDRKLPLQAQVFRDVFANVLS